MASLWLSAIYWGDVTDQEVPYAFPDITYKELTLSRANKSIRIFNHVVESLSKGVQPNLDLIEKVGYLYRTTAVYGSGKFGLADRFRIKNREEKYPRKWNDIC